MLAATIKIWVPRNFNKLSTELVYVKVSYTKIIHFTQKINVHSWFAYTFIVMEILKCTSSIEFVLDNMYTYYGILAAIFMYTYTVM